MVRADSWILVISLGTFRAVLRPSIMSTQAPLAVQRELVLDLFPELLVDQSVVPAVLSGPRGDSLPTQRTAQSGFVHRLQEAALQHQNPPSQQPDPGPRRTELGWACARLTLQKVCVQGRVTGSMKISRQTGQRQSSKDRLGPLRLSDTFTPDIFIVLALPVTPYLTEMTLYFIARVLSATMKPTYEITLDSCST